MTKRSKHIPGLCQPLVPPGKVHRPRKSKGSYFQAEEQEIVRREIQAWLEYEDYEYQD